MNFYWKRIKKAVEKVDEEAEKRFGQDYTLNINTSPKGSLTVLAIHMDIEEGKNVKKQVEYRRAVSRQGIYFCTLEKIENGEMYKETNRSKICEVNEK